MKLLKPIVIALAFLSTTALSQTASVQTGSISGSWKINGDVVGNPVQQICTFSQDGKKLSGSCKSPESTDTDKKVVITGDVDDKKVTWKFNTDYQGQDITLTFTAKIEAPSEFKGDIDVQPFGVSGTFTATKVEAKTEETKETKDTTKDTKETKKPQ